MIEYQSVSGKHIVTYKDYTLPLNEGGVTIIRGQNRAGKSLSCSVIGNILFDAPPMAVSSRRGAAKDLHTKGSVSELKVRAYNHDWTIRQRGLKSSVSYQVLKDGRDLKIRTKAAAKDYITKIIPTDERIFYTVNYLLSAKGNVLLNGKGTQRKEFFEVLADTCDFDGIQSIMSAKLSELKHRKQDLDLQLRYRHDMGKFVKVVPLKAEFKVKNLRYQKSVKHVEHCQQEVSRLETIFELVKGLHNPEMSLQEVKAAGSKNLKKLRKYQEAYRKASRILNEYKAAKQVIVVRNGLRKKISNLASTAPEDVEADIALAHKRIKEIEAELESYAPFYAWQKEYATLFQRIPDDYLTWLGLSDLEDKEALSGAVYSLRKTIKDLESIQGEKRCPTCHRPINRDYINKLIKASKHQLKIYVPVLKYIDDYTRLQYLAEHPIKEPDAKHLEVIKGELEFRKGEIPLLEKELQQTLRRADLVKQLKSLKKLQVTKPTVNPAPIKKKMLQIKQIMLGLKNDLHIYAQLKSLGYEDLNVATLKAMRKVAVSGLSTARRQLESVSDRVQFLKHTIDAAIDNNARIRKAVAEIKRLKAQTADIPLYEALVEAYGKNGLRVDRIKSVVKLFEANLNKYQGLVFGEPFQFKINVESSKLDILAQRSGRISDVYHLSVSETRCFQLLTLLALLPFIPENMRSSMVVLDEITSGMDKKTRALFCQDFLPKLNSAIPNIIMIEPKENRELNIPGAHEYEVVKNRGVSVLRKI